MWDSLLELTHLNSSKGSRISSLMERSSSDKEHYAPLYHQLLNGKLDKPTFDQMIQDDPSSATLPSLQEEMINTYFFSNLEQSGFNDRKSAEVECWKNWVAVKMLFGKSAMVFPQKTCLKILKQAERFGFHKLIIEVAKQLRLYYGAQLGDSKRFKKYDDLIRLTKKKHLRAQKINSQLNILKLSFLLGKKSKAEILAEVNEIKKEWPEVPQEEQSYAFVYHQYQTRLLGESLQEDLTAVQQTCREAIQFITKYLKGRKGNEDRVFHLVAAFCLMKQGDFSAAIKEVEKTHKLEKKGSPLWFENMAFKIVIAIYTGHWDKAADLLKEVKSQSKFKLLLPKKMEVWMTLESYLNLMGDHGEVDKTLLSAPVKVHLGLSKEETLYHHSEGLYNTHHDIIEAIRVVAQQDQEGIKRASANLKASLGILREKGYFRLAAFAEFLSNVIQKKPTEIDWKEAGSAGDATWNAWPLLLDIQHRAFEEIVPFDRLLQYLRPLNNPIRVSNN